MSKCTGCLQRLCRKHPLQDHGERAEDLKKKAQNASQTSITDLIQSQIKKLEEESRVMLASEVDKYRLEIESDRNRICSKKRKNEAENTKYVGLNPSVALLMREQSDDDESHSKNTDDENSSNDEAYKDLKKRIERKSKKSGKKKHKKSKSDKESNRKRKRKELETYSK